jgi:hypothetical protein
VLVLLAWIYTVYAAEVNVVLTRRLWPQAPRAAGEVAPPGPSDREDEAG